MLRRGRKLAKQVCRKAMRTVQAIKAKIKTLKIAVEMKQAQMTGRVQAVVRCRELCRHRRQDFDCRSHRRIVAGRLVCALQWDDHAEGDRKDHRSV